MLVADSRVDRGHMCLRSSDMAKMDLNAADMALAVWDGYVQDARRHPHQRRPVERFSSIAMMWVS
jgi:hypothetical protein